MNEKVAHIHCSFKLLSVSQGLTGKMAGMPAITSSSLQNSHCQKLSSIKGSVCERCYSKKYLLSRPNVESCYQQNSQLLALSLIPTKQLPFVNAAFCRLESFGDIINMTHLKNYIRLVKKNGHCTFALFSKRYDLITDYFHDNKQPKNLCIVISSLMLNTPNDISYLPPMRNLKIFTVYSKDYAEKHNIVINCGKTRCLDCRRCYSTNNQPIYINELLK